MHFAPDNREWKMTTKWGMEIRNNFRGWQAENDFWLLLAVAALPFSPLLSNVNSRCSHWHSDISFLSIVYERAEHWMEEGHGERFHLDIVEFYLYPERASCTQNVNRLHFHLAWIGDRRRRRIRRVEVRREAHRTLKGGWNEEKWGIF